MGHRVSHDGSRQSVAQQQIGVVREPSKKVKKNQVTFLEDVYPKEIVLLSTMVHFVFGSEIILGSYGEFLAFYLDWSFEHSMV